MAWYWWVLIAVGVVLIGWLKLKVLGKWMESRKAKNEPIEDE
jgi:hypothetical protein